MSEVELVPDSLAVGGEAVARDADGRVVFVRGALPHERVLALLTDEKKSFARARVTRVLLPSTDRQEPPCPHVAAGCGGCDWQHISPSAQPEYRRAIVAEALSRLGGIAQPVVNLGGDLPTEGYRTTVRCLVVGGRAGYRMRASHQGLGVDDCLIAHPLLGELIREGRYGQAAEVTLRVGSRTGERIVVAHPTAEGVVVPGDVLVVGSDELRAGRRAWFHEEVAGRVWRVSATSFFQGRPDGAEQLVSAASDLLADFAPEAANIVDLCSGVGLFAGTVGGGRQVVAVERHKAAVADARHNLTGEDVKVVSSSFERWRPTMADVTLADPARGGLGRVGVAAVTATGASLVILVSCDPASLGRDASLLGAAGYSPIRSTIVDLFPHTSHVETVTGFIR